MFPTEGWDHRGTRLRETAMLLNVRALLARANDARNRAQ